MTEHLIEHLTSLESLNRTKAELQAAAENKNHEYRELALDLLESIRKDEAMINTEKFNWQGYGFSQEPPPPTPTTPSEKSVAFAMCESLYGAKWRMTQKDDEPKYVQDAPVPEFEEDEF